MSTIRNILKNPEYKQKYVLEQIIQEILHISKTEMRAHSERELTTHEEETIKQRYLSYTQDKKPLEYILGHVDFFEHSFFVDENTLIPRPETEYMITAVSEYIESGVQKTQTLFDIGTGCGVLGISVLLQHPEAFQHLYFCDLSQGALEVAKKNYKNLIQEPHNIHFIISNLLKFVYDIPEKEGESVILIANLPYIPQETFENNALETVQKREPKMAFVGGDDGLQLYREMFQQGADLIEKKKLNSENLTMFLEMMTRQIDILKDEFPQMEFKEIKTFHFNIRIVKARYK